MSIPSSTVERKIAILQTAFLGDTLLSIPLAKQLARPEKTHSQNTGLAIICRRGLGDLLRQTGFFELVIEIDKGRSRSYRSARFELNQWWENASERILVSPHESPRSKLFAANLRAFDSKVSTVGYADRAWNWLSLIGFSQRVPRPMNLPEALRQLALLQAAVLGGATHGLDVWKDRIFQYSVDQGMAGGRDRNGDLLSIPGWASMTVPCLMAEHREKVAILAPGSVWKTKQWTEEGYIQVGLKLREQGFAIEVIGTPEEAPLCERVASSIGVGAKSWAGKLSLTETVGRIARAQLAVVNDSGAMHLASLVETLTVAVFGPTVLDFGYRPWANASVVVEPHAKLQCRPCGLHGSQKCPIGTHECMRDTSNETVLAAISKLKRNPSL